MSKRLFEVSDRKSADRLESLRMRVLELNPDFDFLAAADPLTGCLAV